MKYYAEIVGYGSDALEFLGDPDLRYLVLFDYTVPQELAEISVLQKRKAGHGTLEVGDAFIICDKAFSITAIGSEALHTLNWDTARCALKAAVRRSVPAVSCWTVKKCFPNMMSAWAKL